MTGNMMNGEMSAVQGMDGMQGMMPMTQMMIQMGPIKKAYTEMMEAMNGSMHETATSTDKG